MGGEGEKGTRDDAQVLLSVTTYMVINKVWDVGGEASVRGEITNVVLGMLGLLGQGKYMKATLCGQSDMDLYTLEIRPGGRADILP